MIIVGNLRDNCSVKMVFLPKFSLLSLSQPANKGNNIKTTTYLLIYKLFIITDLERKVLKLQFGNPDSLSISERCEASSPNVIMIG